MRSYEKLIKEEDLRNKKISRANKKIRGSLKFDEKPEKQKYKRYRIIENLIKTKGKLSLTI